MIDYLAAMKQAMTEKVLATCTVRSLGKLIEEQCHARLWKYLDGKKYTIGRNAYMERDCMCVFSSYDCERGVDPITLHILLSKVGALKNERARTSTALKAFRSRAWFDIRNDKGDAWKYLSYTVSLEDALSGNYTLEM